FGPLDLVSAFLRHGLEFFDNLLVGVSGNGESRSLKQFHIVKRHCLPFLIAESIVPEETDNRHVSTEVARCQRIAWGRSARTRLVGQPPWAYFAGKSLTIRTVSKLTRTTWPTSRTMYSESSGRFGSERMWLRLSSLTWYWSMTHSRALRLPRR